jgi:hypothetical protein
MKIPPLPGIAATVLAAFRTALRARAVKNFTNQLTPKNQR